MSAYLLAILSGHLQIIREKGGRERKKEKKQCYDICSAAVQISCDNGCSSAGQQVSETAAV